MLRREGHIEANAVLSHDDKIHELARYVQIRKRVGAVNYDPMSADDFDDVVEVSRAMPAQPAPR